MVPYQYDDRTLLDVQQVIPLPEAEEYQVRVRAKATQERAARHDKGGSAQRNLRFWTGLLEKANQETSLHQNVSPSETNWIAATAYGLYYSYVTAYGKGRVELYITRPDKAENKAIFDDLESHKREIEEAYGAPLSWQRLDGKISSRIAADIEVGSVRDEESWDTLQTAMVAGMKRLEAALQPFVGKYRRGESPSLDEI